MNNVIVTVRGTQIMGGEHNVTEFMSEGKYSLDEGYPLILYEEGEIVGGSISTRFRMRDDNTVVIERKGDITTEMLIENGVRHNCCYSTPHGDIMLGFFGKKLINHLGESGGTLRLTYTIDLNSDLLSENEIEITVKPIS